MDNTLAYLDGMSGDSGTYLTPPLSPAALSKLALGETGDPVFQKELEGKGWSVKAKVLGVSWDVDPTNLGEAGWGVLFARDADPAVKQALAPLLQLRTAQANANTTLYREYTGTEGYQPGETKSAWLERHGMGPGPAEPSKVPYYLLLVGSPSEIPFTFQYQLDLQYAVGRIHFDTPAEYQAYAQSVVNAETNPTPRARRVAFFGTQHPDDPSTQMSATLLAKPLAEKLQSKPILSKWNFTSYFTEAATKAQLSKLVGGANTPDVLFTATHGVAFRNTNPKQRDRQGALLCQDYPGPLAWQGTMPTDFYFTGDDLPAESNLKGLISFNVACYGAGTPQLDDFPYLEAITSDHFPAQPFVARLPQRMLAHPSGGSLAVISHIDRAWTYSFFWGQAGGQTLVYESVLGQIMRGVPVGHALEFMNSRYAELSADLTSVLNAAKVEHKTPDDRALAQLWTANNDARSYILLGDPAVRLNGVS